MTEPSARRSVLLVDDDPLSRRALGSVLRSAGYHVEMARSVSQALHLLEEVRPTIGLLDMRLPDGSGWQLARQIREIEGLSDLPLVAVSGVEATFSASEGESHLFVESLLKPVIPRRLLDVVGRHARMSAEPVAAGGLILVVDDDLHMRRVLSSTLTGAGYRVESLGRGDTALKEIRRERPDLLVLDLDLPGLSGPDVLRTLQAEGLAVPTVVLTAGLDIEAPTLIAEAIGVFAVLPKTQQLSRLLPTVRSALAAGPKVIGRGARRAATWQIDVMARQARSVHGVQALVRRREAELNAIAGIADVARRSTSPRELLASVAGRLCDLDYVTEVAAWMFEGSRKTLAASFPAGLSQEEAFHDLLAEHGLLDECLASGELLVLPSAGADPDRATALLQDLGVRSVLAVPLVAKRRKLGLLLLAAEGDELTGAWPLGQAVQAQLEHSLSLAHSLSVQAATAQSFRTIAESLSDGVFTVSASGVVVYANEVARALVGPGFMAEREFIANWLSTEEGAPPTEGDWTGELRTGKGRTRQVEVRTSRLPQGSPLGSIVLTVRDVTAQREHERWLRRLANEDPLTGLPNRRAYESQVAEPAPRPGTVSSWRRKDGRSRVW